MNTRSSHLGIILLPFERSTSFKKGTVNGPNIILKELEEFDSFDFALGKDPFAQVRCFVTDLQPKELNDLPVMQSLADKYVSETLSSNGFPLCIGGEHTVSLGPIRAARADGELGIVQLDAHGDLRDEYQGDSYSHACVMRRAVEMGCTLLGVGIRTLCSEENAYIEERNIDIVSSREVLSSNKWYSLLEKLPKRIYLTIDMDVFDPAEVPAVGTPEPGGIDFNGICDFLSHLFEVKDVVAADIVEFMPCPGDESSRRLAARLIGIITGLRFKKDKPLVPK
jgi:agmatinase